MTLTRHLAATGVAAAVLSPWLTGAELMLFAVGSILIDTDHYFLYVVRTGRFDVRGMFHYFAELQPVQQTIPYVGLCLFHTIDFFLLVGIAAACYSPVLPLLAGLIYHFLLDLIDLWRKGVPFIRAYFLVEHAIRRRHVGYPHY
jgi:hypothetical protein